MNTTSKLRYFEVLNAFEVESKISRLGEGSDKPKFLGARLHTVHCLVLAVLSPLKQFIYILCN